MCWFRKKSKADEYFDEKWEEQKREMESKGYKLVEYHGFRYGTTRWFYKKGRKRINADVNDRMFGVYAVRNAIRRQEEEEKRKKTS